MAETFEGLGIDLTQTNPFADSFGAKKTVGERFAANPQRALGDLPRKLIEQYNRIAQQGILSEEELGELLRLFREQESFRRSRFARAQRKTVGRRLGPRSGQVETSIANTVVGPSFEREAGFNRKLQEFNLKSRFAGLQGIPDILRFMQDQTRLDEEIRQANQGPGFLDFVNPLATIGGAIFGGPAGAAAGSAIGGGLNNPRGSI